MVQICQIDLNLLILDDNLIIKRVLSGEQRIYQVLVERYQHYVFSISFNILKSREEAEEAAQDTFMKAYRMLSTYKAESRFSTWLYTIAYRSAIDLNRRKKHLAISLEDDRSALQVGDRNALAHTESVEVDDLRNHLNEAIERLKPLDASIITLFYLHERTVKEISEITGLTRTNVKTKLFRLRESLKTILQKKLDKEIQEWL